MKARLILLFMSVYMLFKGSHDYTCIDITNLFGHKPPAKSARKIIMDYLYPMERITLAGAFRDTTDLYYYDHPLTFKLWRSYTLVRLALLGK